MSKFFRFHQNNSGGSFDIDDERGIGPNVWIEADDADDANARAQEIGIYFDGVDKGEDCECCGNRWYEASGTGEDHPKNNPKYDWTWHSSVYVHRLGGIIESIGKPE